MATSVPVTPAQKDLYVRLGRAIREAREDQRLSQRDVAPAVPIAQRTFSHYEKPASAESSITLHALDSIARALNIELEDLLRRGGWLKETDVAAAIRTTPLNPERRRALLDFHDYLMEQELGDLKGLSDQTRRELSAHLRSRTAS